MQVYWGGINNRFGSQCIDARAVLPYAGCASGAKGERTPLNIAHLWTALMFFVVTAEGRGSPLLVLGPRLYDAGFYWAAGDAAKSTSTPGQLVGAVPVLPLGAL